jgi:hypothetical protein
MLFGLWLLVKGFTLEFALKFDEIPDLLGL